MVGKACLCLGGGRKTKEDIINPSVGLFLNKKIGEYVEEGHTLVTIYADDNMKVDECKGLLNQAYVIASDKPEHTPAIIKDIIK